MKKLLLLIILPGFLFSEPAESQTPSQELGKPLISNWLPKDYGARPPNWAIVQDDRGVMYFGNSKGILEYDGVSWRLIQIPNVSDYRSLAKDANGRIYAGVNGDLGYLAPDPKVSGGQMSFVSLLPQLPEEVSDFSQVMDTYVLHEHVYFRTLDYLFRWTPSVSESTDPEKTGEIKVWKSGNLFAFSFVVDDVLYIREAGKGLLRVRGDSLELVPGGEKFSDVAIHVMLPYPDLPSPSGNQTDQARPAEKNADATIRHAEPDRSILVGTREMGLFIYDGNTFHPFKTEIDEFLHRNPIYRPGAILNDGSFLLNTLGGGAVLMDRNGKLLQTIDRQNGLSRNSVTYAYIDPLRPDALWLAMQGGIARVEAAGPFSTFDADRGIESYVSKVLRHQGVLYAATGEGIVYFDSDTDEFKPVDIPVTQTWDLLSIDGQLLAATNAGVYEINGNQASLVIQSIQLSFNANTFLRSFEDSKRIYVGLFNGLASMRRENGIWRNEGRAPGIQDRITSLVKTDDGTLWASTLTSGYYRLTFSGKGSGIWDDVQVERFGTENGLPEGGGTIYDLNGTPYFSIQNTIYLFNHDEQRFEADSTFMVIGGYQDRVRIEGDSDQVWVIGMGMAMGTRRPDGEYQWLKAPFRRFSENIIYTAYPDENGVVWFGGSDGIIRYDSNVEINYETDFPALVRQVVTGDESIIFNGAGGANPPAPAIAYANNNLRFAYSASAYEEPGRLQFQTRLEGFDREWSGWSNRTEREFTNLPPGDYRFRVRAMNIYDHVSREAAYSFTILPPWWRTWWAYGVYFFLFGLAVLAADRVQRRRLIKKERERSEAQRKELELQKAAELKLAYDKLEKAHEHLKSAQDQLVQQEKLASLGQLTAGIAHEIKNPLNFVNNFSDVSIEMINELIDAMKKGDLNEADALARDISNNLKKIHEHGSRADGIVKSMLQHSRSGDGKMEPTDLNALVKEYVNLSYHGMRAGKDPIDVDIELDLDESISDVPLIAEDFSRVILNLCNNAFDAMRQLTLSPVPSPPGRGVPEGRGEGEYSPKLTVRTKSGRGKAMIEIEDNGPGIPDEIKDKILQPFFTTKKGTQGTGLGLSISHDIIKAHGGSLQVESTSGQGSVFKITLL
jgi:signal transduction histidine kinase